MSRKKIIITSVLTTTLLIGSYFVLANYGFFSGGTNAPSVSADTMTRGLVGYWEFEEGTGQTAYDASNNSNNGQLGSTTSSDNNDPKWGAGKNGGGMEFDGVDDYVDCGTSATLTSIQGSIEFWVKPNVLNTTNYKIFSLIESLWTDYLLIDMYGGRMRLLIEDGNVVVTTLDTGVGNPVLSVGVWTQVVITQNGTEAKLYIDGQNISWTGTNSGYWSSHLTLSSSTFGRGQGAAYINGSIDSVRVYNRALSADEVRYHYNRGGPVGYWNFDEGSGTTAFDGTGNNNDGTLKSSGLDFDGTNDYVNAGSGASIDDIFDNGGTILAWIKIDSYNVNERAYIVNKYTAGTGDWIFWVMNTAAEPHAIQLTNDFDGTNGYWRALNVLSTGAWYHVAVTYNSSSVVNDAILYVNGKSVTIDDEQIPVGNDESDAAKDLIIGARTTDTLRQFDGSIDEVRIYDTAISAAEIARQHNNDFSQDPTGNLVLLQHFEEGMICDANGEAGCLTDDSSETNNGTLYNFDNLTTWDNGTDGWVSEVKKPEWRWVNGKYKTAGEFNGWDDYVDIATPPITGSQNRTIMAWVKTNTDTRDIISWGNGATGEESRLGISGGKFFFGVFGGYAQFTSIVTDNEWNHVAVVLDGSSTDDVVGYFNGNLDTRSSLSSQTVNTANANGAIGKWDSQVDRWFDGTIDDVRIYDYARTVDEIRLDYQAGMATHLGPSGKTCSEDPAGCMDYGLVGSWGMDENGGQYAYDASDNGNDGTLGASVSSASDDPKWTTDSPLNLGGVGGGSLNFDGVDDYVNCGNDSSLDIASTSSPFTIMAFVKTDTVAAGSRSIYTKAQVDSDYRGIKFELSGDTIWARVRYNSTTLQVVQSGSIISTDTWYHVTFVRDSTGNLYLYQDGIEVASELGSYNWDANVINEGFIGKYVTQFFNGSIDSVRIYNRALSADEVRYHYNKGGPVAEWKFDEGSGLATYDSTDNNNDGTLKSLGLEFDGADDYVDCGTNTSLDITSAITVEAWVKVDAFATSDFIFGGSLNSKGYSLRTDDADSSKLEIYVGDGTAYHFFTYTHNMSVDNWHHIVGKYDGTKGYIYVNGVEKGSTTDVFTPNGDNTGAYNIGANALNGDNFNGSIDGVRIYTTALSAEEIARHYNNDFSQDPTANLVLLQHFRRGMGCDANDEAGCLTDDSPGGLNDGTLKNFNNLTTFDNGVDGWITDVKKSEWRWTEGKFSTANDFDGGGDYIDCGNDASLNIVDEITISAWVKVGTSGGGYVVSKYNKLAGKRQYALTVNTSGADIIISDDGSYSAGHYVDLDGSIPLIADQWHHIAMTFNGSETTAIVYLDGVQDAININTDISFIHTSDSKLLIGGRQGLDSSPFNGSIDDVRIYNYVRTADEILVDYNAGVATHLGPSEKTCSEDPAGCMDYGLVGSWGMDEGAGTMAYDVSDEGNDGTLTNGPKWTTDSPPNQVGGGSLSFDGVNDYVSCGNNDSLNITDNLTVSVWINFNSVTATQRFISKREADNGYLFQWFKDATPKTELQGGIKKAGVWKHTSYTWTPTIGTWYHVSHTYDGANIRLYIDGVIRDTEPVVDGLGGTSNPLLIGTWYTLAEWFDGSIDDVRIYNRALSAEEVRYHYNRGGPVGYWNFDEGEGSAAFDSSINRNNGTLTNFDWTATSGWGEGKYGSGLVFDGSNDYVVGSTPITGFPITMSAWFKMSSYDDNHIILTLNDADDQFGYICMAVHQYGIKPIRYDVRGGGAWAYEFGLNTTISLNTWYHLALIVHSDTVREVYINGVKETMDNSGNVSATFDTGIDSTLAGLLRQTAPSGYFHGSIDDVRIYNYARTEDQIRVDYQAGVATHFR